MAEVVPVLVHLQPPLDLIPVRLQRSSPLFARPDAWGIREIRACSDYRLVYPFREEDLDDLAYFFDYRCETPATEHARLILPALLDWWRCWSGEAPAMLAFERLDGKVVIHDTRPIRDCPEVELEGDLALAYLACNASKPFHQVAETVWKSRRRHYGGGRRLREEMNRLVENGLMLREGGNYLSLANDLGSGPARFTGSIRSSSSSIR
jgi:magnesium-protoporphyrin IX monomethyl ester (oxidative) cyclase